MPQKSCRLLLWDFHGAFLFTVSAPIHLHCIPIAVWTFSKTSYFVLLRRKKVIGLEHDGEYMICERTIPVRERDTTILQYSQHFFIHVSTVFLLHSILSIQDIKSGFAEEHCDFIIDMFVHSVGKCTSVLILFCLHCRRQLSVVQPFLLTHLYD